MMGTLYSYPPQARVRLVGFYSDPIEIAQGTRQGCPLPLLLFSIAIETLGIAIRDNPDIQGVTCSTQEHKCVLFADDILLFGRLPLTSLPVLMQMLQEFCVISGLKVNETKSLALNINTPESLLTHVQEAFPFQWQDGALPYLGISLTATYSALYSANYPPFFLSLA